MDLIEKKERVLKKVFGHPIHAHQKNENNLISQNVQTFLPYMYTNENSSRFAVTN